MFKDKAIQFWVAFFRFICSMEEAMRQRLKKYRSSYIKDLVWTLLSPCPLNAQCKLPLITDEQKQLWFEQHQTLLTQWDEEKSGFDEKVESLIKNKRLGYYFEALMHAFFEWSPHFKIVLANHQVIRKKQTLGELDFILKYGKKIFHLELAIKYYLQDGDALEFKKWLGPNARDNLALKIEKLKNHQLLLTHEIEELKEVPSHALIAGQFYQRSVSPPWQNKNTFRKSYFKLSEVEVDTFGKDVVAFYLLTKPHWLSHTVVEDETLMLKGGKAELLHKAKESFAQKKAVHVGLRYKKGYTSIMIVPDAWPTLP